MGRLGGVLGASWGVLGRPGGVLGTSRESLGRALGVSGGILGNPVDGRPPRMEGGEESMDDCAGDSVFLANFEAQIEQKRSTVAQKCVFGKSSFSGGP